MNSRLRSRRLIRTCYTSGSALFLCAQSVIAHAQQTGPPPASPPPAAQSRAAPESFLIAAFDVSGAKILDQSTIENAVYDHVGPERNSADVEAARAALQAAYTQRGYESVQVDIPPQPEALFAQGIVQLRVTEAPVGHVEIAGSRYHSVSVVRNQIPSLAEGKPLNTKTLEAELTDANRFPDRTVTPSFKAGKVPGTVDVDLTVQDSLPLHGSLSLDNDHNPLTRPLRVNASLSYSDLWHRGHTIAATYLVAPQNRRQSEVIVGSYTAPLLGTPWTLTLSGYKSNSNVAALGGVNVLGNGYQIGARAIYRLASTKVVQNVSFGLDYKNFKQNTSVAAQLAQQQPIEYVPLVVGYGLSAGSENTNLDLNLSATAGIRAFKRIRCFEVNPANCSPANEYDQFKNKGTDSNENFVRINVDATLRHAFKHDIVGTVRLFGQIADSHLIPNEQFSIGGLSSVRGYLLSEGVGDAGYAASAQLDAPSLSSLLPNFVDELRFFGFMDYGHVKTINPLAGETARTTLMSVGGGGRIKIFKHFFGEVAVGVPLRTGANTRRNDPTTTFSAKSEF